MPWAEKHIGLALAKSQIAAIRSALTAKVLVMTGGPGVGKTTIVKAILRILAAKDTGLLLCAPTGRASQANDRGDRHRGKDHSSTIGS
jgi:exodeoxyribonuclease V alpha subunit